MLLFGKDGIVGLEAVFGEEGIVALGLDICVVVSCANGCICEDLGESAVWYLKLWGDA